MVGTKKSRPRSFLQRCVGTSPVETGLRCYGAYVVGLLEPHAVTSRVLRVVLDDDGGGVIKPPVPKI